MSDAIGIMEGAFFVSNRELLAWINDLLGLNYTKVEQMCTGAAHCQVLDSLYPGKVPLSRVKFNGTSSIESIANFKILQNVFAKCGIEKVIEVDRLVKGKPLDNLEFMQWMKRFFDLHYSGTPYCGVERRRQVGIRDSEVTYGATEAIPYQGSSSAGSSVVSTSSAPQSVVHAKPKAKPKAESGLKANIGTKGKGNVSQPTKNVKEMKGKSEVGPQRVQKTQTQTNVNAQNTQSDQTKAALEEQNTLLKFTIDGLERERDFYFGKLREVEVLCQTLQSDSQTQSTPLPESSEIVERVLDILYAKDENDDEENDIDVDTEDV